MIRGDQEGSGVIRSDQEGSRGYQGLSRKIRSDASGAFCLVSLVSQADFFSCQNGKNQTAFLSHLCSFQLLLSGKPSC